MIDWIDREIIGSESCQTPLPQAALKKLSQSSTTSMSSLGIFIRIFYQLFLSQTGFFFAAESLPSPLPSYPPPPVPTTARRIAPLRRPSPGQSDSSTRFLFFCHGNFAHNEIQFCRHIDARESQYIANSVAVFKRSFSKQSHQFCRL